VQPWASCLHTSSCQAVTKQYCIIWYQPMGGDARRLGGNPRPGGK